MKKISLNNYKMNEAVRILKEATESTERKMFKIQCNNCTISIATENNLGHSAIVEVALRNVDDSAFIPLEMDGFTEERPIIRPFPLIAFPAFIRQFQSLEAENFAEVWDTWETISCYM